MGASEIHSVNGFIALVAVFSMAVGVPAVHPHFHTCAQNHHSSSHFSRGKAPVHNSNTTPYEHDRHETHGNSIAQHAPGAHFCPLCEILGCCWLVEPERLSLRSSSYAPLCCSAWHPFCIRYNQITKSSIRGPPEMLLCFT